MIRFATFALKLCALCGEKGSLTAKVTKVSAKVAKEKKDEYLLSNPGDRTGSQRILITLRSLRLKLSVLCGKKKEPNRKGRKGKRKETQRGNIRNI